MKRLHDPYLAFHEIYKMLTKARNNWSKHLKSMYMKYPKGKFIDTKEMCSRQRLGGEVTANEYKASLLGLMTTF